MWGNGQLLTNVDVTPIYFGSFEFASEIDTFYKNVLISNYFGALTQYSTPAIPPYREAQTISWGSNRKSINGSLYGPIIDQTSIIPHLKSMIKSKVLTPTPQNTYYPLFFGPEYNSHFDNCVGTCSVHASFLYKGQTITYSVIPHCSTACCTPPPTSSKPHVNALTCVASSDLVQAVTNPHSGATGWSSSTGAQIANLCANRPAKIVGYDGSVIIVNEYYSVADGGCVSVSVKVSGIGGQIPANVRVAMALARRGGGFPLAKVGKDDDVELTVQTPMRGAACLVYGSLACQKINGVGTTYFCGYETDGELKWVDRYPFSTLNWDQERLLKRRSMHLAQLFGLATMASLVGAQGTGPVYWLDQDPKTKYPMMNGVQIKPVFVGNFEQSLVNGLLDFYASVLNTPYFTALNQYSPLIAPGGGVLSPIYITPTFCGGQSCGSFNDNSQPTYLAQEILRNALITTSNFGAIPYGGGSIYYPVFFGQEYDSGFLDPSKGGFFAEHTMFYANNDETDNPVIWGLHPHFAATWAGCGLPDAPNGDINLLTCRASHELIEAVTNPYMPGPDMKIHGIVNNQNYEISDICYQQAGTIKSPTTGKSYTVNKWWSNLDNKCVGADSAFQYSPYVRTSTTTTTTVRPTATGTPMLPWLGIMNIPCEDIPYPPVNTVKWKSSPIWDDEKLVYVDSVNPTTPGYSYCWDNAIDCHDNNIDPSVPCLYGVSIRYTCVPTDGGGGHWWFPWDVYINPNSPRNGTYFGGCTTQPMFSSGCWLRDKPMTGKC
ncbi:hypothetical protein HDU79_005547 [Rhizoclosmatium sp. JEL0117]|nr:hypothetical protein HDU79_005547 [Rhizoclosmatium sp. JEL0117]